MSDDEPKTRDAQEEERQTVEKKSSALQVFVGSALPLVSKCPSRTRRPKLSRGKRASSAAAAEQAQAIPSAKQEVQLPGERCCDGRGQPCEEKAHFLGDWQR